MATPQFASPPRDALDIVFSNRNRAYGAYQLRRAYPRYLKRALGIGMLLIGFGIVLPQILNAVSDVFPEPPPTNTEVVLGPPPEIDPTVPPPPPPPPTPPPPARSTVRFVPPTPVPDEAAEKEEQLSQEEVLSVEGDVSTKTQESEGDAPPSLDNFQNLSNLVESAPPPDENIYDVVGIQKMPTFPGDEDELRRFLAKNIKYPPHAIDLNIEGTVALSFVVGKDGNVRDIVILKEIGGGCGKEAVRVTQAMPRWLPGEANGHAVKVRYTLPVKFKLQ